LGEWDVLLRLETKHAAGFVGLDDSHHAWIYRNTIEAAGDSLALDVQIAASSQGRELLRGEEVLDEALGAALSRPGAVLVPDDDQQDGDHQGQTEHAHEQVAVHALRVLCSWMPHGGPDALQSGRTVPEAAVAQATRPPNGGLTGLQMVADAAGSGPCRHHEPAQGKRQPTPPRQPPPPPRPPPSPPPNASPA